MGSLIDELQRREAAARAEAEELRGRIAELTERLARAGGRHRKYLQTDNKSCSHWWGKQSVLPNSTVSFAFHLFHVFRTFGS